MVRLWSRTVNHLRGTPISREALANWIAPMRATTADEEDGVLVVRLCAPGTEARRIAEQRFHGAIVGAMSTITGRRVALIIEAQVTAPPQSRLEVEA